MSARVETMRLHGYFRSSAAWRVRIGLNLKGIAAAHASVHLPHREQSAAPYRALNPQGLVPALETEGQVLVQSLAILEWLEETHPTPPFLPADPAGRARVRALALVPACDIHPLQNLRVLRYLKREYGRDQAALDTWARHWNALGLEALEAMLAGHPQTGQFCHGDAPGLADICLVPQLGSARRFGLDLRAYPTLSRIDAACAELPAFADAAPDRQPDAQ